MEFEQDQDLDQDLYYKIVIMSLEKTDKFYSKIFQKKWLPGMKREMPRKCIFSLQNLKNPVRNFNCQFLECVYEYENIKILKTQHNNSKGYTCINCGSEVNLKNIFQDQKINSILYFDEKAFINNDLELINCDEKPYFDKAKEFNQPLNTLESQNTKIFEYYFMQTLMKQKLEMLEIMKKTPNSIFKEFAERKNIIQELGLK